MLKKFTKLTRDNKGFSLIEVIVSIFIVSVIVFSIVETYRYVISLTGKSKVVYQNIEYVKNIYNKILLDNDILSDKGKFTTNINETYVEIKIINIYSTNPRIYRISILTTNNETRFSVYTSIYDF